MTDEGWPVEEMTLGEGREMVGREVSARLGITLDEFFANLDAGRYNGTNNPDIMRLAMLAPFAR